MTCVLFLQREFSRLLFVTENLYAASVRHSQPHNRGRVKTEHPTPPPRSPVPGNKPAHPALSPGNMLVRSCQITQYRTQAHRKLRQTKASRLSKPLVVFSSVPSNFSGPVGTRENPRSLSTLNFCRLFPALLPKSPQRAPPHALSTFDTKMNGGLCHPAETTEPLPLEELGFRGRH